MKNWLSVILQFLPAVLTAVKAVEATIEAPGATKKNIVLGVITAGAAAAGQFPQAEVQGIGNLIDAVVGQLNASGVFTKPAPVAVAAKA